MRGNWPETAAELLDECNRLICRYDLYTLGEHGEPPAGETQPRVDGTKVDAGEYQHGVAMIPAQWVTHVVRPIAVDGEKLTAAQVREAWRGNLKRDCLYDPPTPDWQAIADELNASLELLEVFVRDTCELEETDIYKCGNLTVHELECSECGDTCEHVNGTYELCPHCGRRNVCG